MFVDREAELSFFNHVLDRQHPGPAQFILLYGRRRVGKTHLLRHWAEQGGVPYTYWAAEKEPAAAQRRKLFARVDRRPVAQAPLLGSWMETWEAIAQRLGQEKHILILDGLPYAADGDPAMLSALQHAWDQHFQQSRVILVICGSQVQSMETLQQRQSPLFGRFTGQWYLQPLPFYTLKTFFPNWTAAERVAARAIMGGVPAYFKWLDPTLSLVENIRQRILFSGSMFLGEPALLLYDEVREPQSYLAILKTMKGPIQVRPLFLHKEERIAGLVFMTMLAVLAYTLLEMLCRRAGQHITSRKVFKRFEFLAATYIQFGDRSWLKLPSALNETQQQLIDLLKFPPPGAYFQGTEAAK